ncbi:MAG TPA: polyhydroxyalkanoic acid system family protein [Oligoflexia bacterium]|nr:polyhydroxyalkanoic acid system family protein [Oligoflexia bacterium]
MEYAANGSAAEIYLKLKKKLEDYRNAGKLEQLKEVTFDDAAHTARATGPGFKANIACKDGKVVVELDLNFLLKPMRGKIEEKIGRMVASV